MQAAGLKNQVQQFLRIELGVMSPTIASTVGGRHCSLGRDDAELLGGPSSSRGGGFL